MKLWPLNQLFRRPQPPVVRAAPAVAEAGPALVIPAPETKPEWTGDMQQALLVYLRSPSGGTLLAVLRHNEELLKSNACDAEQRRVDHARGRAVGYREAIASLIVLSAPPPPQEEEKPAAGPDGDAGQLREQLSHQ